MSDDRPSPFQPSFDPIAPPPSPVPVTPVARPSRGSRGGTALNGLLVVASLVAVGGIAFGIGRATASSTAATTTGRFANGQLGAGNGGGVTPNGSFTPGGGPAAFGGAGGSIALQGTVVSVTADTLTLKTASGQTVEIPLASSTTYGTETASDASAVTQGAEVRVQLQGGRGAFGGGDGNGGRGGQGPGASPAPGSSAAPGGGRGFNLGPAVSVTVLP